jgi:hypothetical protein
MWLLFANVIGDSLTREELDAPGPNRKAAFWIQVAAAFREENPAYAGFVDWDEGFGGIDPSVIVAHGATKLQDLWKGINSAFVVADENFRVSGTHDMDFKNFVGTRMDVLYLSLWLKVSIFTHLSVDGRLLTWWCGRFAQERLTSFMVGCSKKTSTIRWQSSW